MLEIEPAIDAHALTAAWTEAMSVNPGGVTGPVAGVEALAANTFSTMPTRSLSCFETSSILAMALSSCDLSRRSAAVSWAVTYSKHWRICGIALPYSFCASSISLSLCTTMGC